MKRFWGAYRRTSLDERRKGNVVWPSEQHNNNRWGSPRPEGYGSLAKKCVTATLFSTAHYLPSCVGIILVQPPAEETRMRASTTKQTVLESFDFSSIRCVCHTAPGATRRHASPINDMKHGDTTKLYTRGNQFGLKAGSLYLSAADWQTFFCSSVHIPKNSNSM